MSNPKTELDRTPFAIFKYTYACVLLIFSVVIVMGLIFTGQTNISNGVHPAVAFVVCWGVLIWLSMVEGGQCSLVGLPPIDRALYKESHPLTHKICEFAHRGDNLDRYLMGRQFLVVFIVFFINLSAAPLADASLFGLPDWVMTVFLQTGVAMILFTAQIGQLAAQCNASHMMLDYINNYFMLFTLYVCMAVEFSGLVHASYVIQLIVAKLAGKPIESKEPARNMFQSIFFWSRCLMSVGVLGFALAVTLTALFEGKTTMWKSMPDSAAVILFFLLMSVVGLLEGMQIAFFAVSKMTKEERGQSRLAKMTCDVLFADGGRNLPGFMIGRQICVVGCMFIVARVCTLNVEVGTGQNVFGVPDGFQSFLNTGLLAALITTILGSIAWQLVAGAFPIAFLSNPLVYVFLRFCLLLEATGICAGAWVLARVAELVTGWKTDEHFVGTAEDRKARSLESGPVKDTQHMPAISKIKQILGEWKISTSGKDLTCFCEDLFGSDESRPRASPVIDAEMAMKGMHASEVKMSELASGYVATPNSQLFPTPQRIVEHLLEEKSEIPCFLLPPNHPQHVPPHIVAFWLMSQQNSKPIDLVVDVAEK